MLNIYLKLFIILRMNNKYYTFAHTNQLTKNNKHEKVNIQQIGNYEAGMDALPQYLLPLHVLTGHEEGMVLCQAGS